ncbi:MAG: preprotein translocase subunit YajC [Candidatus Binatia bacterium]|nr:preprotein translocase subunit YajC [Candidatus Binatia bacterium]
MNAPDAGALIQMAPFALILVVFYFLLIRPQQKKAKETQEMLDNLKVGDPIISTGGIHGKIVKLGEGDVQVEVAPKVQIKLSRSAVGQVNRPGKTEEKS